MKYDKDPLIEEIHRTRREIAKQFNYDPHAFGKFLAEREKSRKTTRKKTTNVLALH